MCMHSYQGSVLQCVAVCCSALQCVAVCCSVLQCVAMCCSVCCREVCGTYIHPYQGHLYMCFGRGESQGQAETETEIDTETETEIQTDRGGDECIV